MKRTVYLDPAFKKKKPKKKVVKKVVRKVVKKKAPEPEPEEDLLGDAFAAPEPVKEAEPEEDLMDADFDEPEPEKPKKKVVKKVVPKKEELENFDFEEEPKKEEPKKEKTANDGFDDLLGMDESAAPKAASNDLDFLNDLAVPNDKKDNDSEGESKPSGADPFAFLTF